MSDPYMDDASVRDLEEVRCLLCGRMVERFFFDIHLGQECDGIGYEEIEAGEYL